MYITPVATDRNRKKTGHNSVVLQLVATGLFDLATARDGSLAVPVAVTSIWDLQQPVAVLVPQKMGKNRTGPDFKRLIA